MSLWWDVINTVCSCKSIPLVVIKSLENHPIGGVIFPFSNHTELHATWRLKNLIPLIPKSIGHYYRSYHIFSIPSCYWDFKPTNDQTRLQAQYLDQIFGLQLYGRVIKLTAVTRSSSFGSLPFSKSGDKM